MTSWHPEYDISISDSDEDDENSSGEKRTYSGREAILIVVDANLYSTLERFKHALDIIRSAFLSGLLVNDKDLIGVMFANTEQSPEPYEPNCLEAIRVPENCAVFLPPRQLTTAIVEHYLRFLATAPEKFGQLFGIAGNDGCGSFSHMLRLCLDLIKYCNYTVDNSTIVYLTDRETPHEPHSDGYEQALLKAADLGGKEVEFQVVPMVDEFNYDKFYREFICLANDYDDIECFQPTDAEKLREILADRKLKQDFARRSLGHFKFSLGPDLQLSAQYYNYFEKAKGPRKVLLQREDNAVVRRHRVVSVRKQDPTTLELGEPRDINMKDGWYEINLGNKPIRLSYEQVNRVRNLHAPGMMLLGFKPRSELSTAMYSKHSNFMYPDDRHIEGSKRLFRALWERCRARDKIAVCLFMCKRKSMPRYVALVPVSKEDGNTSAGYSLLSNDGFKIVYLGFASYIRDVDLSDWNSIENHADDEAVAVCERLVRKLRLEFKPNILCDPELDQLQSKLLALAFGVNFESLGSQYFPNAECQDERIAAIIPDFDRVFGVDLEPVKKRSAATTSTEGRAVKVAKLTDSDLNNKHFVLQMISNKTLGFCTVSQLHAILEQHFNIKMTKSAKKQDLIDKIVSSV